MSTADLTERMIQRGLISMFRTSSRVLMPNYTPRDWWECDLFRITKAGYFYEYEIKLTRGDFKADAKKVDIHYGPHGNGKWGKFVHSRKHERLGQEGDDGPREFWWVVREDLIGLDDIEDWAGLMYARVSNPRYSTKWPRLRVVRHARRFKRQKMDAGAIDRALTSAYYRYIYSL